MKHNYLFPTLALGLTLLGVACSDDDGNSNPKPPDVGTSGSKNTSGSGGKGSGTAGTKGTEGGATGDGGTSPGTTDGGEATVDGGSGGSSGSGGTGPVVTCTLPPLGEDGCFNCPEKPAEFLNRCTDGACVPFENTKQRLPLLEADGSLPDLPN